MEILTENELNEWEEKYIVGNPQVYIQNPSSVYYKKSEDRPSARILERTLNALQLSGTAPRTLPSNSNKNNEKSKYRKQ